MVREVERPVVVVIEEREDVIRAVRTVASGRDVALLLPVHLPAPADLASRPLAPGAQLRALQLLAALHDVADTAFLEGAAALLGVASFPRRCAGSPNLGSLLRGGLDLCASPSTHKEHKK